MSNIDHSLRELNHLQTVAERDQWLNRIHPLVKLACTVFYIIMVVSVPKYALPKMLLMAAYPAMLFVLGEISVKEAFRRMRIILPVVCLVGIANPFLDTTPVLIGGIVVRAGVISMITLMLKGIFAVMASYVLIATTTIEKICYALRLIRIPKILVTQIMLMYRYISLLMTEVHRITQAYTLRAPGQKGIHVKAWGSLAGQLLLRSINRANEVFDSMLLRGYCGEFAYVGARQKGKGSDIVFLAVICGIIAALRFLPIFG